MVFRCDIVRCRPALNTKDILLILHNSQGWWDGWGQPVDSAGILPACSVSKGARQKQNPKNYSAPLCLFGLHFYQHMRHFFTLD